MKKMLIFIISVAFIMSSSIIIKGEPVEKPLKIGDYKIKEIEKKEIGNGNTVEGVSFDTPTEKQLGEFAEKLDEFRGSKIYLVIAIIGAIVVIPICLSSMLGIVHREEREDEKEPDRWDTSDRYDFGDSNKNK